MLLAGCGGDNVSFSTRLDTGFKQLFTGKRTASQNLVTAVSSPDPDVRRDAVAEISKSEDYDREWAIKGFVAIALLESDQQTRCVAIRALARTGDPRAVETALTILNVDDYKPEEVWPPTPLVRWDACVALADLSASGQVPPEQSERVRETLLKRLRLGTDRHARIAAARGLGEYQAESVVEALIDGLRDSDFAVAHQCENSLVRLTGYTHNTDAYAWQQWLESHRGDLFAHAGEVPESRQLPYDGRWGKFAYETKDLFNYLWPGAKEE